jgi:hypothetical protein
MRKFLTILFLICSLGISAQTKWYIATTGSDTHGKGTSGDPWLTLKHAVDTVTGANFDNDTIIVGVGTFTETSQAVLGVKINIKGVGATSILSYTYVAADNWDACIVLHSTAEGTAGSQSISYLKIDGNETATAAISVLKRNDVICHHLTVVDFTNRGIQYQGTSSGVEPVTYMTGAKIYSCNISESSTRSLTVSFGLLNINGTDGMEIHDNILSQTLKPTGKNGNIVYTWGGWDKHWQFYNNTCTKPTTDGVLVGMADGWNFHLECGRSTGGNEVYNNTFTGGVAIDIAGGDHVKGAYDYSWHIYGNTCKITAQISSPAAGTHLPCGMDIERKATDLLVEKNLFENYPHAIQFGFDSDDDNLWVERMHFNYNIFKNIGFNDGTAEYVVRWTYGNATCYYRYIYFDNNVIIGNGAKAAFILNSASDISYLYIRNCIIENIETYGWLAAWNSAGTFSHIIVQNNDLYNNVSSNDIYYHLGKTITDLTYADNIETNPLFVTPIDFHLQVGSPAIDNGIDIGLKEDYDGNVVPFNSITDIGAYEYGSHEATPGTTLGTGTDNNLLVDKNGRIIIIQ